MGSNVAQALPRSGLVQLGIMLRSGADEGRSPQVWSYFPGAGGKSLSGTENGVTFIAAQFTTIDLAFTCP